MADPENVYEISSLATGTEDVFATKSYAYFTYFNSGLKIVDVSDLSNPELVGEFITPGKNRNIFVSGSFAYIANEKGLYIVDVGDPQYPREVSHCFLPHCPGGVVVSGSYAYVAVRDSGLRVVDVSNPSNPYVIGVLNYAVPGWGWDCGLDISGHYCYLTANGWEDGLRVIDISNPAFPYQVGQCSLWCARDVAVSGLHAYVLADQRFSVIDISDPYNPNEVGFFLSLPPNPSGISVSGMTAFVIDSSYFYGFDIADPPNPQLIFDIPTPNYSGIEISGQFAYIATLDDILFIFDVSDPANPVKVGYYLSNPRGICNELSVQGTYAYVVSGLGLHIYQFFGAGVEEEPKEPLPVHTSLKILQNPATGNNIELMLTTSNPDNCALSLYNTLGREVKTFYLTNVSLGKTYIHLSVDRIPNGVYFLKINGDLNVSPEKVVILK